MPRTPSIRQCDIERAQDAVRGYVAMGVMPKSVVYPRSGGFIVNLAGAVANDDADAALDAYEAKHGHDQA
jgi:hypothetical protein